MAYHRLGRNESDRWSKHTAKSTSSATGTDDESDDRLTSTIVDELSSGTPVIPHLEVTPSVTGSPLAPTSLGIYPPTMSYGLPDDRTRGGSDDWLWTTAPPPWATQTTYGDDRREPHSSTIVTSYSKSRIDPDENGLGNTPTPIPTPIQFEFPPPEPTDDDFGQINHGATNGSNKTLMYAAAAAVLVVIIVIGLFIFSCLRKRWRQRQAAAVNGHKEETKMQQKPVESPYIAPITTPSPLPQAALHQYPPLTTFSSHPPTANSSQLVQPVILGPIPFGNNSAYLTGMDTSDLVPMRSGGVSRQGTVVDRDSFADGRSLEEAPPPYRPSSLPPASLASTSQNSSVRMATAPHIISRTQLIERSPFDDASDDEVYGV